MPRTPAAPRAISGAVLAAALALALAPSAARADEPAPDPAAVEAGEANLESLSPREGLILSLGIGGAMSIGFGMDNATGQGGAFTLRLAHVANSRATITVEYVGSALFFNVSGELYRTDVLNALVGGQYYLNPALWIRGAVGFGRYAGNELRMEDFILRERFRYRGPAASVGAGVDLVRLKRFRAGVEICATAMINSEGVLSSNGFLFGVSFD